MTAQWTGPISAIVTVLFGSGLVVALLTLRPQRRKISADAASVLTCASASWVARVQESADRALARADLADIRAERAEVRADQAEQEAHELRRMITGLRNRLDSADTRESRMLRMFSAMGVDIPEDMFGPPTQGGSS